MNAILARPSPLFLLSCLSVASAQVDGSAGGSNFIAGPELPGLPFRRIDSVDLDGNLTPEVVVLRGSVLILYPNPDVNEDYVVVAEDAIDVGAGVGDQKARLVYTSASGLESVVYREHAYAVELESDSIAWQGATRVRVEKDGLLGVAADERTFIHSEYTPTGVGAPQTLFTIGPAVRDLKTLDWSPAPVHEIAILTSNGVQLRSRQGVSLMSRGAIVAGDAIAVVSSEGSSDGLAWVTRLLSGQAVLVFFHASFKGSYQGPLALGLTHFDSATSADIDADGDGDLVLAQAASGALTVLENQSEPESWSAPPPLPPWAFAGSTDTIELGLVADVTPSSGQVLCTNLFNDHDAAGAIVPGYAMALASPSGLSLRPKPGIRSPGVLPTSLDFAAIEFDSAKSLAGCPSVPSSQGPHSLWTVLPGDGWGPASGATHLELIVRDSPAPGLAPLQTALHHLVFPLAPGGIPSTPVSFTGTETPLSAEDSPRSYFAGVRPVRLDAQGTNILEAWRWSVLGVSANCAGLEWMGGLPSALDLSIPFEDIAICADSEGFLDCGDPLLTLGGARYIPSGVPVTKFPSSGPGVMPVVYPWNY